MNRITFGVFDCAQVVNRLPDNVEHAPESSFTDRHRYRTAGVDRLHAAHHAVSWQHGDRSDSALAEMLLNFGYQIDWCRDIKALGDDAERLIDRRQLLRRKLDVYYRTDNLHHAAGCADLGSGICAGRSHTFFLLLFAAYEGEKTGRIKSQSRYHKGESCAKRAC